jgi:hypothetical protein
MPLPGITIAGYPPVVTDEEEKMTEKNINPLRSINLNTDEAIDRMKSEIDELIRTLDFKGMSQKVQELGRKSPIALGLAALTIGVAAGMLMRRTLEQD